MAENEVFAPKPEEGKPWDVAVVGSGPAAFTAAIYTTRGAASTIILGGEKWGGQLMLTMEVDNYPALPQIQGPNLMQKMREHATRYGAEFIEKTVDRVDFSKHPFEIGVGEVVYKAKSVLIATGAETRWLGIPGEKELIGKGVSACAPCDAPFYKDKKTAVVGGGDSAMEEALVLTKYASYVYIVHRRDEFRASAAMQKKVFENEKIKTIWDTEVIEIIGQDLVSSVKFKTKAESKQAEELRRGKVDEYQGKIISEEGGVVFWQMPIEGLFIAIGHIPSTKVFSDQIKLDEKSYIQRIENEAYKMATSTPGVFVAGDVHDYSYKQAITAAGYGCMAALDALHYLDELKTSP
jgi:thioredoxin reductase (NADPH)